MVIDEVDNKDGCLNIPFKQPTRISRERTVTMYPTSDDYYKSIEQRANELFENVKNRSLYRTTPICAIDAYCKQEIGGDKKIYEEIKKAFIEGFERGAEWGIDKDWYV